MSKGKTKTTRTDSAAETCEALSISRSTLQRYAGAGCPHTPGKPGRGHKFDATEVAAWMKSVGLTGEQGRHIDPEDEGLRAARTRKESAMADSWELKNQALRDTLISADEAEAQAAERSARIRAHLSGVGADLADKLVGLPASDIQRVVDSYMINVCQRLSTGKTPAELAKAEQE